MLIEIGGKQYKPVIKDTEEGRIETFKGMSIEDIPEDYAKLLIFDTSEDHSIWMKDTPIPLDIIFMDDSNVVKAVRRGEPNSLESITAGTPIKKVLELRSEGAPNIQIGDVMKVIESDNLIPEIKSYLESKYPGSAVGKIEIDDNGYTIELQGQGILKFSKDGKPVSEMVKEKFIFDYDNRIDSTGSGYKLDGYKKEGNRLIKDKASSVEGTLHTINEKIEDLAETQVGDSLWTYGILDHMQEGGSMKILDEKGKVQMELEGAERIISIKETKQLIKLAKDADTDKEFINLANKMINIIEGQNNREPEFINQ